MTEASFFPEDRKFIAPDTYDAIFAVMERLEATIDRETVALARHRHDEIAEFTRQKRQAYLELNRLTRCVEHAIPSQALLDRLSIFRTKLESNDAALRRHLKAVQEVTGTIIRVMQDHESDGTYSRAARYAD